MKKKSVQITLTVKQAELILWACEAGLEQHCKFVRHDGWDAYMSRQARHANMWSDRRFERAIRLISAKLDKAK